MEFTIVLFTLLYISISESGVVTNILVFVCWIQSYSLSGSFSTFVCYRGPY